MGFLILLVFTNLNLMEFQVIFSVKDSLNFLWIGEYIQNNALEEYPVNAGTPEGSILEPTLFPININELPGVFCNIPIYVDDTTLNSKSDQVSDLWQ